MTILDENDQRRKEKKEEEEEERKKKFEEDLLETIINYNDRQDFEDIEKKITPRALANCESSSLLMGMKVFSNNVINMCAICQDVCLKVARNCLDTPVFGILLQLQK